MQNLQYLAQHPQQQYMNVPHVQGEPEKKSPPTLVSMPSPRRPGLWIRPDGSGHSPPSSLHSVHRCTAQHAAQHGAASGSMELHLGPGAVVANAPVGTTSSSRSSGSGGPAKRTQAQPLLCPDNPPPPPFLRT